MEDLLKKKVVLKLVPKKEVIPTEVQEHIMFAVWLGNQGIKFNHSPNGGYRHYLEAVKLKRMGVSPGYPDIFIPIARKNYHGFHIEMKRQKGGTVSPEQKEWLEHLRQEGYFAEVAKGFEHAKILWLEYIGNDPILSRQA